jgi:SAM-dependent methyltransferase
MPLAPARPSILAPHVATPTDVVERMLELALVVPGDVLYDLGCGDGRIAIAAAKRGARAWGCDVEEHWVAEARRHAEAAGVSALATFEVADATSVDVAPATVVALYLVEWSTRRLGEKLAAELRPGARVVSHNFAVADGPPDREERWIDAGGEPRAVRLWTVGTGLAAGPTPPAPKSALPGRRGGPVTVEEATFELLAPYLGEKFLLDEPPAPIELDLAEVSPLSGSTSPPGAFRVPFRLTFHGPLAPVRAQGIVPLIHPELGRIEIFVVPIGPAPGEANTMRYEAIFT